MIWEYWKGDFLFGFLLAIPFLWIKGYVLRTLLSIGVPLALVWFAMALLRDPVHFRINKHILFLVAGGVCAAHLRLLWTLAWKWILEIRD
jgi:hypothetical protein